MTYIKAHFQEFESLQQAASQWDLDFRLLSKNNLSTSMTLFTTDTFQLGRVSLNGKIDQHGLCPAGFRSIVIPVPGGSHFHWFNRLTVDYEVLIYPRDGTIDCVSFDQFDVYVFSVEERYLLSILEKMKYAKGFELFAKHEVRLQSTEEFCSLFQVHAEQILSSPGKDGELELLLIDLLNHITSLKDANNKLVTKRGRNRIWRKAVDFVADHIHEQISIPSLCSELDCSERTLQYAFQERFRVTPKDYIKATKLQKVKRELLTREELMISDIASKYGFWHMGQFAADFRKQFGKLPSQISKYR